MMNPSNKGNTSSSSACTSPSSSPPSSPSPTNQIVIDDAVGPSMSQVRFNFGGPGREQLSLKIPDPEEVLADLTTGDNTGGNPPPPPEGQSGAVVVGNPGAGEHVGAVKNGEPYGEKVRRTGTPTCLVCKRTFKSLNGVYGHLRVHPKRIAGGSVAIEVGGGAVVLGKPGAGGRVGAVQKGKPSVEKVRRTGTPTCLLCKRTFKSLNGVYGHLRVHSKGRATSSSSSSKHPGGASEVAGEGGSRVGKGRRGEAGLSSPVRGLVEFDLNQPVEGAAAPAEEGNADKGKKLGFDLNELPPDEDKP